MSRRRARDVMTTDVVAVPEHALFKEIAELMAERQISGVPVVGVTGRVIGVVTESDLLRKEEHKDEPHPPRLQTPSSRRDHRKAAAMTARDLMSAPPITVGPDASVVEVARRMHHEGIKRVPVVDGDGGLMGILSRADLLKLFVRADEDIAAEIDQEIIDRYFPGELVHVAVLDGIVTLDGQVEQRSVIPLLSRMAQSVDGVIDVIDHLAYAVDDTHPREAAHLPNRPPTPTPRY